MLDDPLTPREGKAVSATVGTMNFGGRTPEPDAQRIVARALERGVRVFDVANVYGDGRAESVLGRSLGQDRARVLIATKVGLLRVPSNGDRGKKAEGLAPERVLAALDESLTRLATDYVDLYYLHAPDPNVPLVETLDALKVLLAKGSIRAWGMSNYASWEIVEANQLADRLAMPRPRVSQVLYNLLVRQLEIEYFRFAERHPIHTTVYNPLAGGLLAGKHARGAPEKGTRFDKNRMYLERYWSDRFFDRVDAYASLAREAGLSLVELAYGWLATRSAVDSVLVGPGTLEHLDQALDAIARPLAPELVTRVDALHRAAEGTDARYAR